MNRKRKHIDDAEQTHIIDDAEETTQNEKKRLLDYATFSDVVASGRMNADGVEVFDRGDSIGKSVRACRAFKRLDIVCSYGGKVYLYGSDTDNSIESEYKYLMLKNVIVDGDPRFPESRGHAGSFINDARGKIKQNAQKNNVYFSNGTVVCADGQRRRIVWIRAAQPIEAGQELWLDYGRDYWTSRQ